MRIEVLGPIRVVDGAGRDLTPDGVLQRRLLALLVLHRGRVVSTDVAIEALWPVHAPRDPVAALHNHVFRLRRGLPEGTIESIGDGYRLVPSGIDLDAHELAETLTAGEGGTAALAVIDAALERWSGPAYPELDDLDDGRIESMRLDELRARAREARAECHLATGEIDGLVTELAALVDAEPLRERPRALLMAVLARAGRRVEALRVYDDFRRILAGELGIEPSPSLAAQHADLLVGSGVAVWTPASRLPLPATSLIGRDALLAEVLQNVEDHRLVTLVGPGGVGKTRLAIEVGHRLRAERPERPVVMCELAAADEESAVDVLAAALEIEARPGVGLVERVAAVLGDSEVVLILDNCEHVLDPVAELVERMAATCPNVRVVATSRERLRLAGERVRSVPVLPWAAHDGPAVQLFLERARAVAPDLDPDAAELACIGEIVRRLDGLPLAVELAAALLHTHDVAEVAAGLDQRFALLSSGYRTSSRHASLGATVSWSYGLLDDALQQVFSELSVFTGSFTASDAAAICDLDPAAATAALAQLAERSLVMRAPGRRYILLETLRAFGAEQLAAAGRDATAGGRHAEHQLEWIERADDRLLDPGARAIAEIDAAIPELRTALGWLLDHGRVEPAGRLVVALLDYGLLRLRPDVLAWAHRVTDADPEDLSPVAAEVWVASAYAAWMAGDVTETGARARRALRVSERSGGMPARVASICGSYELFEGNLDEAVRWYRHSAEAAVEDAGQRLLATSSEVLARAYAGDPTAVDLADQLLDEIGEVVTPHAAYVSYCAGEANGATDVERARRLFARAVHLAELTSTSFVTGLAGASLASIDARLGDPQAAAEDFRRLIVQWRRAGVWSTQWTMLRSIAGLLERLGRPRDAAILEGAVRTTTAGHRLFGADAAALREVGARLRAELGDDAYESAWREGTVLDGDAAVEHALRALRPDAPA
jgi:predicted ATPase/DNA-binding SARP family transcriptional activator